MNRYLSVGAILILFAALFQAQDRLNGTWEGETPNGTPIVLTLEVKGTVLTGTLDRGGEKATLADGKVSKTTFTFKATINGETEGFSGEPAGDEIKVWLDRQGAARAIVLRRAKRK